MKYLLFFSVCFISLPVRAQFTDSLELQVGTTVTLATQDYLPLWLVANRWGTIADQQADLSTHVGFSNKHLLNPGGGVAHFVDHGLFPNNGSTVLRLKKAQQRRWHLAYGVDLYNHQYFQRFFLEQAYVKIGTGHWELRGGRYEEVIGEVHPELSTGSLGISANALPIPKIGIAVTDYTDVPFTHGRLQYKGLLSHGWMGQERLIKQAFLHEKALYLRINTGRLKLYGGMQHFAFWGGKAQDFTIDRSLGTWMDVFLAGQGGNRSTESKDSLLRYVEDHRGVIEGGLEYRGKAVTFKLYQQTPLETQQYITPRNIDRLAGFSITPHDQQTLLQGFLLEALHTRQMNNFTPITTRESYYNHGIYKTGWEYNYRILGTPLFINRDRGSKYFDTVEAVNWQSVDSVNQVSQNIINNRVIALHTGVSLLFTPSLYGRTLVTYTRNYGTYSNEIFKPFKDQWYLLQEFMYRLQDKLSLKVAVGVDSGQLSQNAGILISLLWTVNHRPKTGTPCKLLWEE